MALGGLIGAGNNAGGTDTQIQIWGLYHLTGTTVSVFVDVWDCGDFTVASDGSVTVPILGTTLGGVAGIINLATLIADTASTYGEQATSLTVHNGGVTSTITVPVVIGTPFVAQGQRVRSITPVDSGTEREQSLGISRRTQFYAILVKDAIKVNIGTSLTPTPLGDMILTQFVDPGAAQLTTGFDGVWRETFDDPGAENYDSMLCWQTDRPYPFCLMSVSQFIVSMDQ